MECPNCLFTIDCITVERKQFSIDLLPDLIPCVNVNFSRKSSNCSFKLISLRCSSVKMKSMTTMHATLKNQVKSNKPNGYLLLEISTHVQWQYYSQMHMLITNCYFPTITCTIKTINVPNLCHLTQKNAKNSYTSVFYVIIYATHARFIK